MKTETNREGETLTACVLRAFGKDAVAAMGANDEAFWRVKGYRRVGEIAYTRPWRGTRTFAVMAREENGR